MDNEAKGAQFNATLVNAVAQKLHGVGFVSPNPESPEIAKIWDDSPTAYKNRYREDAQMILAELAKTHVIVPKVDGAERDAAADLAKCEAIPREWEYEQTDDGHEIRMGTAIGGSASWDCQHSIDYDHMLSEDDGAQYEEAEAICQFIVTAPAALPYWIKQAVALRNVSAAAKALFDHVQAAKAWQFSGDDEADKAHIRKVQAERNALWKALKDTLKAVEL